ncbi:uracil-DNA glycosylase [Aerococcaceae bacterium WGS1372]
MIEINNEWQPILNKLSQTESYKSLKNFLIEEFSTQVIYPPMDSIWTAFELTDYSDVKVVILGQDPYHGPNQAHGLSFSVKKGVTIPPSLRNIYKELEADLGYPPVNHGNLTKWAKEGILLLNTVLTVRASQPNSHKNKGWEPFTDSVIASLNNSDHPIVFILWGKHAQAKKELINLEKHYIIESSHPSPFSANQSFLGSRPFSRTNELLIESGQRPVDWQLKDIS